MSLNIIEMVLDKFSPRTNDSYVLKNCTGSRNFLGNSTSLSHSVLSKYPEALLKTDDTSSTHDTSKRSPLNSTMTFFRQCISSYSSLSKIQAINFTTPAFEEACRRITGFDVFQDINESKIKQFEDKIFRDLELDALLFYEETFHPFTHKYMNEDPKRNFTSHKKQSANSFELNHSVGSYPESVVSMVQGAVERQVSSAMMWQNKKAATARNETPKPEHPANLSELSCSAVRICPKTVAAVPEKAVEIWTSRVALQPNKAPAIVNNEIPKTNQSVNSLDLSCVVSKVHKNLSASLMPEVAVETQIKCITQLKSKKPPASNGTLNEELSNRKTKELQKRSKKRRRRQKKNKKSDGDKKSTSVDSSKELKTSKLVKESADVCKGLKCDIVCDVISKPNNAKSVQMHLPDVSTFVITIDSAGDDSDWDENSDSEWLNEASEFEFSGLYVSNLAASKPVALLTIPASNGDDLELCQLNTLLRRVNREWNEATKDLDRKSRSSIKVSFAPDDELEEVFDAEIYERKGEWEMYALERLRFKRRIDELEKIISPCLLKEHREKVYQKLHKIDL